MISDPMALEPRFRGSVGPPPLLARAEEASSPLEGSILLPHLSSFSHLADCLLLDLSGSDSREQPASGRLPPPPCLRVPEAGRKDPLKKLWRLLCRTACHSLARSRLPLATSRSQFEALRRASPSGSSSGAIQIFHALPLNVGAQVYSHPGYVSSWRPVKSSLALLVNFWTFRPQPSSFETDPMVGH